MSNPYFRFKQFTIRHDRSALKVGTDGVLLGAWASLPLDEERECSHLRILDVGTGSGLVALMLAQRYPTAEIDGIDIDGASVVQATENVESSPFRGRVFIKKEDYNNIVCFSDRYDLIVSNPPFYQEDTLSGNEVKDAARHTVTLSFETLVANTAKLLCPHGVFCVVLPYASATAFIAICAEQRLYLRRRMDVRPTDRKPFNRVLLAFSMERIDAIDGVVSVEDDVLTLCEADGKRTTEYAQITKDFYL